LIEFQWFCASAAGSEGWVHMVDVDGVIRKCCVKAPGAATPSGALVLEGAVTSNGECCGANLVQVPAAAVQALSAALRARRRMGSQALRVLLCICRLRAPGLL
jgi:hypothetical protein